MNKNFSRVKTLIITNVKIFFSPMSTLTIKIFDFVDFHNKKCSFLYCSFINLNKNAWHDGGE